MNNNVKRFEISDYVTANNDSNECLDISKEYRILVPLNHEAEDQLYAYDIYDNGEIRQDMMCLEFHEDTFYYMEKRLFDFINVECDLLINMYEEEVIENEQLDKAIKVTQMIMDNTDDRALTDFSHKLLDLMKLAKGKGTVVGFYF